MLPRKDPCEEDVDFVYLDGISKSIFVEILDPLLLSGKCPMAGPGLDVYRELPLLELALLLGSAVTELRVELHAESREPGRLFNGLAILLLCGPGNGDGFRLEDDDCWLRRYFTISGIGCWSYLFLSAQKKLCVM